jgi:hypothetical protein
VAARTFDEVRYGGRPGSPAAYRAVADADDRVAAGAAVATLTGGPADAGALGPAGLPTADTPVVGR